MTGPVDDSADAIARASNVRNNAMHQQLRLARWGAVRDALWRVLDPRLAAGSRIALVGAGSGDDVPLERICTRAAHVELVDFDRAATDRALARVPRQLRDRVHARVEDVTGGCADLVLQAVRDDAALPESLPLPYGPIGDGGFDVVVGDMLYTQLLHAGLLALDVQGARQHELMRRYDPHFTRALVQRIHASLAPDGVAVHVHDVACWSTGHDQPIPLDEALDDPDRAWRKLRRHDACDPLLVAQQLRLEVAETAWWRWPFEPNKQFLVRACVASESRRFTAPRQATGRVARWP